MKTITQTHATQGQLDQLERFGEDAIKKAIRELDLDNPSSQRVIEAGDEYSADMYAAALASLKRLSTPNEYADEEVSSKYGYLSGYKPEGEDLDRQIGILQKLFPGLGGPNPEYLQLVKSGAVKIPNGGEKFFAITNIWKKGGLPAIGATYSACTQKALDLIKQTRNGAFQNYREGAIDEKHLRQTAKTKKAMEAISEAQGNPDILIVAAQFGIRHGGRSVRRARVVMTSGEFGLGAFAICCMLLTHIERLQHYDDLWIDCAGDEFSPGAGGEFSRAPYFSFCGGKVEFGAHWADGADGYYGSASGFSPQNN